MKTTLLAHRIHHFTPWAAWRSPRDHFKPLLLLALAVLAADIVWLLKIEAMYRRDAMLRNSPALLQDAREGASDAFYGADIVGQREGQPLLNW